MPSPRVLVFAAVLGVAVAVGFAFTVIGLAGEVVAGAALIALAVHGVTRLQHRSPS